MNCFEYRGLCVDMMTLQCNKFRTLYELFSKKTRHIFECSVGINITTNMYQLAGKLSKRTLTLDEKIKLLDFKKKNPSLGYRAIGEKFNIGKTAGASILSNEDKIRKQHELFHEKSKKRTHHGKYQEINDILYEWYKRCCASNNFSNGVMLKKKGNGSQRKAPK